jgi:putative transposase
MPIPSKYHADFNECGIYHIYNRTNNREKLFLSDENRYFFLQKYLEYMSAFLNTYCWCLLPNHFHLLAKIKAIAAIQANLESKIFRELTMTEKKFLNNEICTSELIEQSFKRFFQSYSLSFNNVYDRKGNLFYRPFKRIEINKETQFTQAVVYIHANPVKHQLVTDFKQYQWSSWHDLISESPTELLRQELLDWFGNKDLFIRTHKEMTKYYYDSQISIEE